MHFPIPFYEYSEQYRYKYLALYHAIRAAVRDGILPAGSRLPSSRELAEAYGISRGSVAHAYDLLLAEGYVHSAVGSGTFVAQIAPAGADAVRREAADIRLSSWGERIADLQPDEGQHEWGRNAGDPEDVISFRDAGPSVASFPQAAWKSALARAARDSGGREPAEPPAAGDPSLRAAIAAHLRRSRGIAADAEQICLFNGSMQAIVLLTQLLLGEGERAVLEDPCYHGIVRAVAACGAIPVPAPVDGDGLIPRDWNARVLFTTPGRQFPTGAVLSPARRRELLAWAEARNAVIIEDDYDTEFRWAGRPQEPLKALDRGDRVVYVGSFSKTMFASLRIGFAVLPRSLTVPVLCAKSLYEPIPPAGLEQRALARFMLTGDYERHLRRMRRIYSAKLELFRRAMEQALPGLFQLKPSEAGLLVFAPWQRSGEEYAAFKEAAKLRGAVFRDGGIYRLTPGRPAACFSLSHLDDAQILEGIHRMESAWKDI